MKIKQVVCAVLAYAAVEVAMAGSVEDCSAASRSEALAIGDRLFQQRAFQLAGECYRLAGDYNLANLAFLKAAEPQSKTTERTLATNREEVKAQLRKLQQAFGALR